MTGTKWTMPHWMMTYAPLFVNTGCEPTVDNIERMVNSHTDPVINLPVSTLEACVKTQVHLLTRMKDRGLIA